MSEVVAAIALAAAAFTLSSSAGLGGSLILVPGMSMLLGPKEGVAVASLLLAVNNVAKVAAYRRTVPIRAAAVIAAATAVGAAVGARLLVAAPDRWVGVGVIVAMALTLAFEASRRARPALRLGWAPALAVASGASSGFSGTSGPMKGIALRSLALDRMHLVGAASIVSLVGDATKTAVYAEASLLGGGSWLVAIAAVPLMIAATAVGQRLNADMSERAFFGLFWGVMGGYTARLLLAL